MERSYSNNLGRRSPKEYFETGPLAYEEILFEDIVDDGRTDVRTDDGQKDGRTTDECRPQELKLSTSYSVEIMKMTK